jgi:hypothetical protein
MDLHVQAVATKAPSRENLTLEMGLAWALASEKMGVHVRVCGAAAGAGVGGGGDAIWQESGGNL